MSIKGNIFFKIKTFVVLCLLFILPLNLIAQDKNLWNSINSIDIKSANALFSEKDINSIVGVWESHNGVIFMIKECYDKESYANYQMVMLKDRVYYGNWHIKIPSGNIIGLISNTSDKNIFSCKFKLNGTKIKQFHLSLKGKKLVYTGSSALKRKLFAIKLYPIPTEKTSEPIPTTPLSKSKIEKEGLK